MHDGMMGLQMGAHLLRRVEEAVVRGPRSTVAYFGLRGFLKGFLVSAVAGAALRRRAPDGGALRRA
ncbi:MAG: hypothetical protein Q8P67_26190, partial [archaeon]|nr:hypothetical protein [archaeon]